MDIAIVRDGPAYLIVRTGYGAYGVEGRGTRAWSPQAGAGSADTGVMSNAAANDKSIPEETLARGLVILLPGLYVSSFVSPYGDISGHIVLHRTAPNRLPLCEGCRMCGEL